MERFEPLGELIFRSLFSLIFFTAGLKHILGTEEVIHRFNATPWAAVLSAIVPAEILVLSTGLVLLVGGLGLLVGAFTRLSAFLLALTLIPITITVQLTETEGLGPLFKNIALLGGLIHFIVRGSAHWSVDVIRHQRYRKGSQAKA